MDILLISHDYSVACIDFPMLTMPMMIELRTWTEDSPDTTRRQYFFLVPSIDVHPDHANPPLYEELVI